MDTIANVLPIRPQATRTLTPLARYCVSLLATEAYRSGVTPQSVRGLSWAGPVLDPPTVSMIADELAALRAQAS